MRCVRAAISDGRPEVYSAAETYGAATKTFAARAIANSSLVGTTSTSDGRRGCGDTTLVATLRLVESRIDLDTETGKPGQAVASHVDVCSPRRHR